VAHQIQSVYGDAESKKRLLGDLQSGLRARPSDETMPDIAEERPQDNDNRQGAQPQRRQCRNTSQ
jgi:hypothetical protein